MTTLLSGVYFKDEVKLGHGDYPLLVAYRILYHI